MNKPANTEEKLKALLLKYRKVLEKVAYHDGINGHSIPSPKLAQLAKDVLTEKV